MNMGFGIIFAVSQAEVVVEQSASIEFDPQTRLPLRGTSGQVSQITLKAIRSGDIKNSLKSQGVMMREKV